MDAATFERVTRLASAECVTGATKTMNSKFVAAAVSLCQSEDHLYFPLPAAG